MFLGTVSPVLATKTDQIDKYFQGLRQFMPRSVTIDEYSTIVVSENAVLFAGMDTFSQTKDGSVIKTPARFTMLITKTNGGHGAGGPSCENLPQAAGRGRRIR